jgi:hypothetical protein
MAVIPNALYPVAIFQDRYSGTYSGALWFAVSSADENNVLSMAEQDDGPLGDDVACMYFWEDRPSWISTGNTPDEALSKLLGQHGEELRGE